MPSMHFKTGMYFVRRLAVLAATLFLTACAEEPTAWPDISARKWVGPVVKGKSRIVCSGSGGGTGEEGSLATSFSDVWG